MEVFNAWHQSSLSGHVGKDRPQPYTILLTRPELDALCRQQKQMSLFFFSYVMLMRKKKTVKTQKKTSFLLKSMRLV